MAKDLSPITKEPDSIKAKDLTLRSGPETKSVKEKTSTEPIIAELIPKDQADLTKEEREIKRIKGRMFTVVNDAMSYMHEVVKGAKGNRTRMRACESFIRFLPDLDHQTGSQPLHLHLNVPRPNKKES